MLEALAQALEAIVTVLFGLLIIVVASMALAGLAAAILVKVPVIAAAAAVVLVAGGVLYLLDRMPQQTPAAGGTTAAATPLTLDFPGVSVRMPLNQAGAFCAAAEHVTASRYRTLYKAIRATLDNSSIA